MLLTISFSVAADTSFSMMVVVTATAVTSIIEALEVMSATAAAISPGDLS